MSKKQIANANPKMVPLDGRALEEEIEKAGATKTELSRRIGLGDCYITNCISKGEINYKYLQRAYAELAKGGFEGRKTSPRGRTTKRKYSRKRVTFDSEEMRDRIDGSERMMADLAEEAGTCRATLIYWLTKGEMPEEVFDKLDSILGQKEKALPVVTEKVYTAQAVKEIMKQAVNTFTDQMIDYFAEILDVLDKEGM